MKQSITFFIFLVLLPLSTAAKKHEKPQVDPRLKAVRAVFVKGNNEGAAITRQQLEERTCFTLVSNEKKADAVLDIAAEGGTNDTVSATLTNQDGDLLWSTSYRTNLGLGRSSSDFGPHIILMRLNAAAFPDVHQGMHGVKRDACPQ